MVDGTTTTPEIVADRLEVQTMSNETWLVVLRRDHPNMIFGPFAEFEDALAFEFGEEFEYDGVTFAYSLAEAVAERDREQTLSFLPPTDNSR